MDLPTYTNIWRIEKRLYKLYDFRLPAPLPITWIAVFSGITFPYVVFLFAIGVPFNHDLVWLYVLPPGVLTWLTTRPVIESKRLPELIGSQLRYLSEPRSWNRMAPATEKDEILILVRVWRRNPQKQKQKQKVRRKAARQAKPGKVRPPAHSKPLAVPPHAEAAGQQQYAAPDHYETDQFEPTQQRATAQPAIPRRASAHAPATSWPTPVVQSLVSTGWEPRPAPLMGQPAAPEAAAPEAAAPEPAPAPEAAAPEPAEAAEHVALEVSHDSEPAPWLPPPADLPSWSAPEQKPQPATPAKASVVDLDAGQPVPSVERALSGPGAGRDQSWRRRVKVVAGGQGPGKRDQEDVDRARAKLPLGGPRWIVVLGCHSAAGQTLTALMTGRLLVSLRHHPVAALTGDASTKVKAAALVAGQRPPAKGFDIIGGDGADYQRLHGLLAGSYPLTIVDPAPAGLTRVLGLADQLIIVAPATDQAASNLASTQQWLDAHGYGDLAARAVTVINGVRKDQMPDVLRAESVARGRCRAIVRVPYDQQLSARPVQALSPNALPVQVRLAYTALAGVVVAGLAAPVPADPDPRKELR